MLNKDWIIDFATLVLGLSIIDKQAEISLHVDSDDGFEMYAIARISNVWAIFIYPVSIYHWILQSKFTKWHRSNKGEDDNQTQSPSVAVSKGQSVD